MTLPLPPGVGSAHMTLGRRLDEALEVGLRIPCREDPEAFFAESATDRRAAAVRCLDCPLLAPCRRYALAAGEAYGVWAGVDRESLVRETRGGGQVELDLEMPGDAA